MGRVYKHLDNAEALFKSFTVSLARWCFETLYEVMEQLLSRRAFMENEFDAACMGQTKDPKLINDIREASRWGDLWMWLAAVFTDVIAPLEYIRRLGNAARTNGRQGHG